MRRFGESKTFSLTEGLSEPFFVPEVRGLVYYSLFSTISSSNRHGAGEKWCALAMRLLHHLSTFKCNYQHKVQIHFEHLTQVVYYSQFHLFKSFS